MLFKNMKIPLKVIKLDGPGLLKRLNPKFYSSQQADGYSPVYSCSFNTYGYVINKLKLYGTLLTSITVPASSVLEYLEVIPTTSTYQCLLSGCIITLPFYITGQFFHQLIGKIYVNSKNTDEIKFSYCGFFGKRMDIIRDVSSIHPLGYNKGGRFYSILKIEDPRVQLKICLNEQYIDFWHSEYCTKILGESINK